jgi:hypothetical protein
MTDSLAVMAKTVLLKEENDYINNILKACSEDLRIKTYTVIREGSWESMKRQVDAIIEHNPLMELASQPVSLSFLDVDKFIAILVEYEEGL